VKLVRPAAAGAVRCVRQISSYNLCRVQDSGRRDPRRSVCVMDKDKGSNPGSTEVRSHETPIAVELWAVAEYNISLSFRYALV
jgi:hypothetical protein